MEQIYDMIVIGGGPAGYTAALYAARAGLSTLVLEKLSAGGQMALTEQIDNYPGFEGGIDGFTLGEKMQQSAERFGAVTELAEVYKVSLSGKIKTLDTSEGVFQSRTVVIATGASPRPLGVPGEEALVGKGVHYCAACDGAPYRGKTVAVVGGDARQAAAGRALARAGYTVGGVQQLPQADCILLPLPLEQADLPLTQLLGMAKPGALALGGKVTDSARTIARAAGVELVDYFARPELTVYNAIPTAEGCIGILLERRSRTLWGAAVLVLGFGPVGRALAVRLAALGARVTVAARRPVQRAMAEELGLLAVPLTDLAAAAAAFDTVVNTIPAPVLTAAVLAALPKGCLIVDLASKPGGTDFAAARRLGHTALHALSLPTVWAPETAGEALARTVQAILQEREGTI